MDKQLSISNNKSLFTFDMKKFHSIIQHVGHLSCIIVCYTFECPTPVTVSFHFSDVIG